MKVNRNMVAGGVAWLALSVVLPASAAENVIHPGAKCSFYSGTPQADTIFSRSGGNGILHNISGAAAKVECSLPRDANRDEGFGVFNWELDAAGTSGWDIGKCDLFDEHLAFPTSSNTISPAGSFTVIRGTSTGWEGQGDTFFGTPGHTFVIICTIPASAGVVTYSMEND